jgi:mannose-6-phosphate isomerase-like protein (cupin superfamily)
MHTKREAVPTAIEVEAMTVRSTEAGPMTIETGDVRQEMDITALFEGLPDNRCQCEHWGYVIDGSLTFHFKDRSETFGAGEVYYAEPGHTPVMHAGLRYVEFSPTDALNKTMEVAVGNAAKLGLI